MQDRVPETSAPLVAASGGRSRAARAFSLAMRIWVPGALIIGGLVMILIGHGRTKNSSLSSLGSSIAGEGLAVLIGGLFVLGFAWLAYMSTQSSEDRLREEAARQYFDRTGRWPDESAGADSVASSAAGASADGSSGAELPASGEGSS